MAVRLSQARATGQIGKAYRWDGVSGDCDYQIIWNRPKYVENSLNYYYDQLTEFNGGNPDGEGVHHRQHTDWAIEFINGKGARGQAEALVFWLCYGAARTIYAG